MGGVGLGEGGLLLQEAQKRTGPANENVKIRLRMQLLSLNVAMRTEFEIVNPITEPVNICLRATAPESSQMKTIGFPIYKIRGNEGRCSKGHDSVRRD